MPQTQPHMDQIGIAGLIKITTPAFHHHELGNFAGDVKNTLRHLPVADRSVEQRIMHDVVHMAILIIVHPPGWQT